MISAAGPTCFDHAVAANHDAIGLGRERFRRIGQERVITARYDRAAQGRYAFVGYSLHRVAVRIRSIMAEEQPNVACGTCWAVAKS